MIKFHMADILPLLPIEQPRGKKSSYYVPCPCCDGNRTRNGHLNISLEKDVFRCPRCDFSGGVLDLYSYYANVDRNEARNSIIAKLHIYESKYKGDVKVVEQKEPSVKEYPLADIDTRNATYTALLNKLSLASDHKDNLLNRGLSERMIENKYYRTTPVVGWR